MGHFWYLPVKQKKKFNSYPSLEVIHSECDAGEDITAATMTESSVGVNQHSRLWCLVCVHAQLFYNGDAVVVDFCGHARKVLLYVHRERASMCVAGTKLMPFVQTWSFMFVIHVHTNIHTCDSCCCNQCRARTLHQVWWVQPVECYLVFYRLSAILFCSRIKR